MDKMLYIAMSGAKQTVLAQVVNTNNLANVSTTGFKADLAQFRAMPVFGAGMPTRVYAMAERPGSDMSHGPLTTTGRELDLAVRGEGWIAVQAPDGSEAYTRAGDLRLDSMGMLVNGAGYPVLGNAGPIAVPPFEKIEIGVDGTISIRPVGQAPNVLAEVERIKLVNPPAEELTKGQDGLMHRTDGQPAPADAAVHLVSGALEGSNVSAVESMVNMITLARQYEAQLKMMETAKDNDAAADQLLRMA
ncbi:MAG: flagellar basal-body rod protein FlgF [Gammaproteobacteria bacterium]|nr:flagellar basal-body rod protein FlgF [Gammaproteobacteria bacterium]